MHLYELDRDDGIESSFNLRAGQIVHLLYDRVYQIQNSLLCITPTFFKMFCSKFVNVTSLPLFISLLIKFSRFSIFILGIFVQCSLFR